jgi:hypothetical protein
MIVNPIKLKLVEAVLKDLGRGTTKEVVRKLNKTAPGYADSVRGWSDSEVNNLLQSSKLAVRDRDNPGDWVFADPETHDREFYSRSRWWDR